jgi:hypothetical protein
VKKAICCWVLASMSLQSSAQAQSGPDATRSRANIEIPSSLVAPLPPQPRIDGEPYRPTPTQQFVCNTGYTQKLCNEEVLVLRKALANYPVAQLGNWTWILVRSEDWKAILLPRGLDPDSPAFTFYPKRETFIEEALVTQVPVRGRELLLKWNMSRGDLLDLAIRHELGHALCDEQDERNADRVAKLLEERKPVSCGAKTEPKRKPVITSHETGSDLTAPLKRDANSLPRRCSTLVRWFKAFPSRAEKQLSQRALSQASPFVPCSEIIDLDD